MKITKRVLASDLLNNKKFQESYKNDVIENEEGEIEGSSLFSFGAEQADKYGDLIAENLAGKTVSKNKDIAKEPGGLIYEADKLGIDMWDMLEALEGMCSQGRCREIDDSTYKVLGSVTCSEDVPEDAIVSFEFDESKLDKAVDEMYSGKYDDKLEDIVKDSNYSKNATAGDDGKIHDPEIVMAVLFDVDSDSYQIDYPSVYATDDDIDWSEVFEKLGKRGTYISYEEQLIGSSDFEEGSEPILGLEDDSLDSIKEVEIDDSDYNEFYLDPNGSLGLEPGELISLGELKEYWNTSNSIDPSLKAFDSFQNWWEETQRYLERYEGVEPNEEEHSEWEEIDSKLVRDYDGMMTDYTLYHNLTDDSYVCVAGDKDLYGPDSDVDMEFDSYDEAIEWFEDYSLDTDFRD